MEVVAKVVFIVFIVSGMTVVAVGLTVLTLALAKLISAVFSAFRR